MATNLRQRFTALDFDELKQNFITFLQGQSTFDSYDFTGSALNVLIDTLVYNTQYNALYCNFIANEIFLDSASKRSNVVSLAKNLGYVPKSVTAPKATITVTVSSPSGSPDTLTLPANSQFTSTIDNVSYNFFTLSDLLIVPVLGVYRFNNVDVFEGTVVKNKYLVADGVRFILPNQNIDMSTITVKVQDNGSSSNFTTYTPAGDFSEITDISTVYFIKEIEDSQYEIYFGNDVIGKQLVNGNVVTITYLVTNRTAANGAKLFSFSGTIGGGAVSIVTNSSAAGGAEIESIDSIKFNAPLAYAAQNRAVTADDYKVMLSKLDTDIQSMNIWGGEDNDPPQYGRVFISVKPKNTDFLTQAQKDDLTNNILATRSVVSILPIVVDPDFVYINVNSTAYFDSKNTTRTADSIATIVKNAIIGFNTTDLGMFGSIFRYSKLSRQIDQSDVSILSNITTVSLHKLVNITLNKKQTYIANFYNPIWKTTFTEQSVGGSANLVLLHVSAISSNGFTVLGDTRTLFLDDDGAGNVRLYFIPSPGIKSIVQNVGTVDYDNGIIKLIDMFFTSTFNNQLDISIIPRSNDVLSVRNQLIEIRTADIVTAALSDSVASGTNSGNVGHIFTPSR